MASLKSTRSYPSVPSITGTPESHIAALQALKECSEIHERRTGNVLDSFITLRELQELGIIRIRGDQILPGRLFDD